MTRTEVFDRMDECTPDHVARMLPLVSAQRRNKALEFRFTFGQYACLKSYLMLSEMTGLNDFSFEYSPYGKPRIAGHSEIHFSISHCRKAIAVAVSDAPVGIDIEAERRIDEALIKRTMNSAEQARISAGQNPVMEFLRLWTRKEAVLKLRGTGLVDDLQSVLQGSETIMTNTCGDYVWSIATAGNDLILI